MRRGLVLLGAASLLFSLAQPATSTATSSPVATTEAEYLVYGRVFPDPHGCNRGAPGKSPYAKGNVCATDFLQFSELVGGMTFLEELYPKFVELYQLDEDFDCKGRPVTNPDDGCNDFRSAGLPKTVTTGEGGTAFARDRQPLYMVRITDETVPNAGKRHYVFPLSIHGIERAGAEGGTRAAEDLATWAACEKDPTLAVCANEQPIPHPLMEATPEKSVFAGEALKKSVVYFIYPNPDGWIRGDRTTGTQFYQRYNGNGVDLNRDWPEQGYTFRPYTPWSEPESRSFGRVLRRIGPHDAQGRPKWDGGIDLHGQNIARAFSFTLIGGSQRPFDKNQRVLQTVKGAWADAEKRLAWSPLIKPNDASTDDPRVYGVQWGTIWDTIAYTVTGSVSNWIDSPIGLNADGLGNEMSLSHIYNCGVGSCFSPDIEQLHVDGNKSLIYSMINYDLLPEDNTFATQGRVGYVHNRGAIAEKASRLPGPPSFTKYPPQADIPGELLNASNEYTYEFDVEGPKQGVYNGGIAVTITCASAQGTGPCAFEEARLEREKAEEDTVQGEDWEVVNSYFNQSDIYSQSGQALHANLPVPGRYRVRMYGRDRSGGPVPSNVSGVYRIDINFTREKGWPDPGQVAYRATNMKFWKDLSKFADPGIEKITARTIQTGTSWRTRYDTIVITNKVYPKLAKKLRAWVSTSGGNLVLTDEALRMLHAMGVVDAEPRSITGYAGYVNFATGDRDVTYEDPLARKINQPGAAEGRSGDEVHRRQTYEPVPLGYAIQTPDDADLNSSPIWYVSDAALKDASGAARAIGTTGRTVNVSLGEVKLGKGRIRFLGAVLPMPTDNFDHPFGVASYGVTYSGDQLLQNLLTWTRPGPISAQ